MAAQLSANRFDQWRQAKEREVPKTLAVETHPHHVVWHGKLIPLAMGTLDHRIRPGFYLQYLKQQNPRQKATLLLPQGDTKRDALKNLVMTTRVLYQGKRAYLCLTDNLIKEVTQVYEATLAAYVLKPTTQEPGSCLLSAGYAELLGSHLDKLFSRDYGRLAHIFFPDGVCTYVPLSHLALEDQGP